jgi:hypothetical protein
VGLGEGSGRRGGEDGAGEDGAGEDGAGEDGAGEDGAGGADAALPAALVLRSVGTTS